MEKYLIPFDSILLDYLKLNPDQFNGKTVFISGGADGIGQMVAIGMASLGAKVAIVDIQREKGEQTLETIKSEGNEGMFIHADISVDGQLIGALESVQDQWGPIDILVNNAMRSFIGSYAEENQEIWDSVFNTNLKYPVSAIRFILPQMISRDSGVIVNMISLEGLTGATAYSASKVGMRSVTLSTASEIGNDTGVSVFAFAPGIVKTKTVTDYFYPEIAKRYGITMDQLIKGVGGNPGYEGLMPAEHCAAGLVDCLANAKQYHGQIVGPFLSLAKAGIITFDDEAADSVSNESTTDIKGLDTVQKSLRDYLVSVTEINQNLEHRISVRTGELEAALAEVREKSELIEETNQKLIDSIHYAERIQKALLPESIERQGLLPDSFIIWEPKDIVGGDFYQFYRREDGFFLVVGDCTGHGVPGGFMTMMVLTMLNGIIYSSKTKNPATILTVLNSAVKTALKQDRDETRCDDGLDIAVCYIDPKKQVLEFAGARFPLIVVFDDFIKEIKADRKSVGYKRTSLDSSFTTKTIPFTKGTSFYLASDGLQDQLGGENNHAFGKKAVMELLVSIQGQPMSTQKTMIQQAIRDYQGKQERQDDITIIGFQIPEIK